jgi:hypothetical protein
VAGSVTIATAAWGEPEVLVILGLDQSGGTRRRADWKVLL